MKVIHFFLFVLILHLASGQEKLPLSLSFSPKIGFLIAHRPHMAHLVKEKNLAYELELSQQDNTRSFTANYYRFPSKGIALQFQSFGNADVLGNAYGILQFTKFNLIQKEKFGFLDFRVGAGMAWITKEYDAETNPKNNAIGSKLNAYINLQLLYTKHWNHFLLGGGLEISHYSNAALTVPNLGLNTPMCFIKAGYNFHKRDVFAPDTNPVIAILPRAGNRFQFHVIGSTKQNLPGYNLPQFYPVIAAQGMYRKRLSFKWDFEVGTDLIYNAANRFKYDDLSFSLLETFQIGVFVGAAANFYRSQIFVGLGSYVYNKINPAGWIYNRIGYRYNFGKVFSALIAIKANFGIADYIEFGIGMRL